MQKLQPVIDSFRWELMGYGFCRAWILEHLAFVRTINPQYQIMSEAFINVPLCVLYFTLALSAVLFIFFQRVCQSRFLKESIPDCMIACGFMGSSFIAFGTASGSSTAITIGFALAGFCGGFFEVKWGLYFLGLSKNAACCNVLLAILLTSICGIFASLTLPIETFLAIAFILLIITVFFDRASKERIWSAENSKTRTKIGHIAPETEEPKSNNFHTAQKAFRRIVFVSLLYATIHMSAITLANNILVTADNFLIRHLANFFAVGVLLIYFIAKKSLESLELSKLVLPFTAAGLFLLLIDMQLLSKMAYFLLCFSNKLFEILIWILVIEFIETLVKSAGIAFGSIVAARNIGSFTGSLISAAVLCFATQNNTSWTWFIAVLAMLLIITLLWLLSEKTFFKPLHKVDAHQSIHDESGNPDLISTSLQELARTSKLTPREIDVFLLLARGKNRATIASELCISQNTAHSHIIHIYQKLNVHDQQELIKLI